MGIREWLSDEFRYGGPGHKRRIAKRLPKVEAKIEEERARKRREGRKPPKGLTERR